MQTLNHVGLIAKYFNLFFKLLQETFKIFILEKGGCFVEKRMEVDT